MVEHAALAVLAVVAALIIIWLALVGVWWIVNPGNLTLREAARLLPDVLRLLKRLINDEHTPRGVRVRVVLLLCYLVSPIDLILDFIPVIGQLDDVIVAVVVLRAIARTAGYDALESHWSGTPDGLHALCRLCRVKEVK